jgi:hypothetical protein
VKSQSENITDLATTTSVVSEVSKTLPSYVTAHEDFRLAPATSRVRGAYQELARKRTDLIFKQERVQVIKNVADLVLARAQQKQDAARNGTPSNLDPDGASSLKEDDVSLIDQIATATATSADAAAALLLITAAITSIDAFTSAVNSTVPGARSPLAIASLNELLRQDGENRIGYVLTVKGLGGQSEGYTKDRRIGIDTYTTLADASIAFMLYDTRAKKIISSGVANGVSSVHGRLGKRPIGLTGPNSADAIEDMAADSPPSANGEQAGRRRPWRRWMFG